MTKATLHDELMRDAGFESDYYVELARRREERRERLRRDLLRTATVIAFVGLVAGGVVAFAESGKTAPVPWVLYPVLGVLAAIGSLADLLRRWITRDKDAPGVWKRITRPWREDQF